MPVGDHRSPRGARGTAFSIVGVGPRCGVRAGIGRTRCYRARQGVPALVVWGTVSARRGERTVHGGDQVADVLSAQGVHALFTLCGGHISPILVGAKARGIRIVDTRHEATAVFAADAVARLTGRPGVAAVTAGPGLTNTVTAVKNAQLAQSPVVLLGGAAPTVLQGRGRCRTSTRWRCCARTSSGPTPCAGCATSVPPSRRRSGRHCPGCRDRCSSSCRSTCSTTRSSSGSGTAPRAAGGRWGSARCRPTSRRGSRGCSAAPGATVPARPSTSPRPSRPRTASRRPPPRWRRRPGR
ncbi:thiamine pyrophosphate-binding protein [Pseudonocardia benzenivorans]